MIASPACRREWSGTRDYRGRSRYVQRSYNNVEKIWEEKTSKSKARFDPTSATTFCSTHKSPLPPLLSLLTIVTPGLYIDTRHPADHFATHPLTFHLYCPAIVQRAPLHIIILSPVITWAKFSRNYLIDYIITVHLDPSCNKYWNLIGPSRYVLYISYATLVKFFAHG